MSDVTSHRKVVWVVLAVAVLVVIVTGSVALGLSGSLMMNGRANGGNGSSTAQQIGMNQAVQIFNNYLVSLRNPILALHEVEEYQNNFYASYYENNTGRFAFQMLIWKTGSTYGTGMMGYRMATGVAMPEIGPNMMWNTKYGMMSGMMGSGMMGSGMMGSYGQRTPATMTVTVEQAKTLAQGYLDSNMPGKTAGDVDTYYGYYNLDVLLNGSTFGMLSVNGYTGQVWYHFWHGAYIQTVTMGQP